MIPPPNNIFIDSSGWVALFDPQDKYHTQAVTFWQQLPAERPFLITNDYVLDETYTILRRGRYGLQRATQVHQIVEQSRLIELIEVNIDYRQRAWALFQLYEDKILSFTDCVCFVMMQTLGIHQVFSFDSDFKRLGFIVRPF